MNNSGAHHIYHAHALGVAGKIDRADPGLSVKPQIISSQATTSLSHMGGYGSDHIENFNVPGVVSFRSAFVEVTGKYDDANNCHKTKVSAIVEGLDIMGIVTADRIVSTLTAQHPARKDPQRPTGQQCLDEPSVSHEGSSFENLQIAGCRVDVKPTITLATQNDTYSRAKNDNTLQPWLLVNQLGPAKDEHPSLTRFYNGLINLLESHGILACSLVNLDPKPNGLKAFGSVIVVPDFGVVHLAELLVQKHSRRLNMLRISLGSPIEGSLSIADTFSNGTTSPPTGTGGTQ